MEADALHEGRSLSEYSKEDLELLWSSAKLKVNPQIASESKS